MTTTYDLSNARASETCRQAGHDWDAPQAHTTTCQNCGIVRRTTRPGPLGLVGRLRRLRRTGTALTAAALSALLLAGCGGVPYTASEMEEAQLTCDGAAQRDRMSNGEQTDGFMLDCLRDELPELDDDQLRRLDHLIEEAEAGE